MFISSFIHDELYMKTLYIKLMTSSVIYDEGAFVQRRLYTQMVLYFINDDYTI